MVVDTKNIDSEPMMVTDSKPKPVYKTKWFIWLMLILLTPVGVFLLWKYSGYKRIPKIIITAAFGTLLMWGILIFAIELRQYGALAVPDVNVMDLYIDGEPAEYLFLGLYTEDLKDISDRQFNQFIGHITKKHKDALWVSIVIDYEYVLYYPTSSKSNLYYGGLGEYAKPEYMVLVGASEDFSFTGFINDRKRINNDIINALEADNDKRIALKEVMLAEIESKIDNLVGGVDTNGMRIDLLDNGVYRLYLPDSWMDAYGLARDRAYLSILLDEIKEINKKYVGNGYVKMEVCDQDGVEAAKYDFFTGLYGFIE